MPLTLAAETLLPILTDDDVAKLLQVKVDTLLKWVRQGRFPAPLPLGSGRLKRWPREVVLEFLDQAGRE